MAMETNGFSKCICLLFLLSISANLFLYCDGRKLVGLSRESKQPKKITTMKHTFLEQMMKQLNLAQQLDSTSNTQPYVNSPFTLPPYDSLPPIENAPPFCVYPPNTPQIPSGDSPPSSSSSYPGLSPPPGPTITVPSPSGPPETSNPSPPETIPSPPESIPSPDTSVPGPPGSTFNPGPPYYEPGPPANIPSPPYNVQPGPPANIPSPPYNVPSPIGFIPAPPLFLPPVVFPPPTTPPPPSETPSTAMWCVAKASVPDPIIREAMNYACASGADCDSIQPDGPCFKPNTLLAHASFAFNSYFQRTKAAGGSCAFGDTAILVTVDPSYDGCHFEYF